MESDDFECTVGSVESQGITLSGVRQIGTVALRPIYESGDAYSDLGGGLRPYREQDQNDVSSVADHESVLFAKLRNEKVAAEHSLELTRTYELGLDRLVSKQLSNLAKQSSRESNLLTIAGYELIDSMYHRKKVLLIDGNFAHPAFEQYGFSSQEEADEYAHFLHVLHTDLMAREVVGDIQSRYKELKSKSRITTFNSLRSAAKNVAVEIIDEDRIKLIERNI